MRPQPPLLEAAARENRLKKGQGLGAAVQRKILEGLKIRETTLRARHLHRADELALSVAETLERSVPGLIRTVAAGDLCRDGVISGTESSQTLRWRGVDSNHQFRAK